MADTKITFGFEGEDAGLSSELDKVKRELDELNRKGRALEETDRKRVVTLKEQQRVLQAQAEAIKKVNTQTQQVGISLARIIQDAPFGIVGVGNNITFLSEQLATIQRNAKLAGQELSALSLIGQGFSQLLSSPVGLISLTVSAATVFSKLFEPAVNRLKTAFLEFTDAIGVTDTRFEKFLDAYEKRLGKLIALPDEKNKLKPFSPKTVAEIDVAIKSTEEMLKASRFIIEGIENKRVVEAGRVVRELTKDEQSLLKQQEQRVQILQKEIDALKEKRAELEAIERTTIESQKVAKVEVGSMKQPRAVKGKLTQFEPINLTAPLKRVRYKSLNEMSLNELENLQNTYEKKLRSGEGDASDVRFYRAITSTIQDKMIELGLREPKATTKADTIYGDMIRMQNRYRVEFEKTLRSPQLLATKVKTVDASDAIKQGAVAQATSLFARARFLATNGDYDGADELIKQAESLLARVGLTTESISQNAVMREFRTLEFAQGIGGVIGQGIGEMIAMQLSQQSELVRRERELALERIAVQRRANQQLEEETRRSFAQRERDIETALRKQQITDLEALARKKEIEQERLQFEEEQALKRRELSLREEELRRSDSNSILRATIANSTNNAVMFAFQALLSDNLKFLGIPGIIAAAIALPAALAALTAVIQNNVRSYAVGGVVKSPQLAIVGDATQSGNATNEEVIFNERLLVKQAQRFAAMVNQQPIVIELNGRKVNSELARSERLKNVVKIR